MNIDEYFHVQRNKMPSKGTKGIETDWMSFCQFQLSGNKLLIVQTEFAPSDEGIMIETSPGKYLIEAKGMIYEDDRRIAKLRIFPESANNLSLGKQLGKLDVDMATVAICDFDMLNAFVDDDEDEYMFWLEDVIDELSDTHGIAVCEQASGTTMPHISTGFGDGSYPVYELLYANKCVGLEAEFIKPDAVYPFEL